MSYYRKKGVKNSDPQYHFDNDLINEKKTWMAMDDTIILGIDMNEDVRTGKIALILKELGLKDLILGTHTNSSPPPMFHCNTTHTPIDTFYSTSTVEVFRAGYLTFYAESPAAPSDGHCLGWIELYNKSILGKEIPYSSSSIKISGLLAKYPIYRKIYNKKVQKAYN